MTRDKNQFRKTPKNLNNYAHYSGIVFQMGAIIFLGTFGGIKLDQVISLKFPLFTVTLSFLSVLLAMYYV